MDRKKKEIFILMAEDDDDDYYLIEKAFKKTSVPVRLYRVKNGEELLDYLLKRGKFEYENVLWPGIILLDLKMPRMNGKEVLKEIKGSSRLHKIPVVILTVSEAEEDIIYSYALGASSYIKKPSTFRDLADAMKLLGRYWWELVELPPQEIEDKL